MRKKLLVISILVMFLWLTGCSKSIDDIELDQIKKPEIKEEIAIIKTNMGEMKLRFFNDVAPKAVNNFKTLSQDSFYDGLKFERVEHDFLIQIGSHPDYKSGKSIYGDFYEDEVHDQYRHFTGAVGLAKKADNENNSNFYIIYNTSIEEDYLEAMRELYDMGYPKDIVDAYEIIGGIPRLDHRYTVFAQVFEGLDVLEKINEAEVNTLKIPLDPIVIESIQIMPYEN